MSHLGKGVNGQRKNQPFIKQKQMPFCAKCEDHFFSMKNLSGHDCLWVTEKEKGFWLGLVNVEMHLEMDTCLKGPTAEIKKKNKCDSKTADYRAFNQTLCKRSFSNS